MERRGLPEDGTQPLADRSQTAILSELNRTHDRRHQAASLAERIYELSSGTDRPSGGIFADLGATHAHGREGPGSGHPARVTVRTRADQDRYWIRVGLGGRGREEHKQRDLCEAPDWRVAVLSWTLAKLIPAAQPQGRSIRRRRVPRGDIVISPRFQFTDVAAVFEWRRSRRKLGTTSDSLQEVGEGRVSNPTVTALESWPPKTSTRLPFRQAVSSSNLRLVLLWTFQTGKAFKISMCLDSGSPVHLRQVRQAQFPLLHGRRLPRRRMSASTSSLCHAEATADITHFFLAACSASGPMSRISRVQAVGDTDLCLGRIPNDLNRRLKPQCWVCGHSRSRRRRFLPVQWGVHPGERSERRLGEWPGSPLKNARYRNFVRTCNERIIPTFG